MLLSFQVGFNFVNAAVVCAILESVSGLKSLSDTTEPSYLKLATMSSFCPYYYLLFLYLFVYAAGVVCHEHDLLGIDLYAVDALSKRSTNFASSSSPAKPSMSSAKRRLVIVLPPILTVPS